MTKLILYSWFLVACAVAFRAKLHSPTGEDENPLRKLSKAITSFSTDLMVKLIESGTGTNIVISPTGIYVALAMVYAGSGGETKYQLESALHLDVFEDDSELYESISFLLQTLRSTKKHYTLQLVNRLYAQHESDDNHFDHDFLKKIDEYFRSQLETLDFSGDHSGSTWQINNWVARMTSGKIKELFPDGTITSDTHMALASAAYFNASWLYRFDKEETTPQTFYKTSGKQIQVPMMNMPFASNLRYLPPDNAGFQALELPYDDNRVKAVILLLNEDIANDPSWIQQIIEQPMDEISSRLQNVSLRLSLPKFRLRTTLNLRDSLQALGIEDVFNGDTADLSYIDAAHAVALDAAMHQTYIGFSEDGEHAPGAVTDGYTKRHFSFRRNTVEFVVDRPFFFKVLEQTTGCELFFAFVKNPLR